ncbi:hypothetical protein SLA2020_051170 [Shorea laevis]
MDVMAVICLPDHWYYVFSMLRDSLTLWQQVCLKNWPLGISLYKDEINGGYMNVYDTMRLCCGIGSS